MLNQFCNPLNKSDLIYDFYTSIFVPVCIYKYVFDLLIFC